MGAHTFFFGFQRGHAIRGGPGEKGLCQFERRQRKGSHFIRVADKTNARDKSPPISECLKRDSQIRPLLHKKQLSK